MHVKQEHDKAEIFDCEVDFDDNSTESCEKEYDTGDERMAISEGVGIPVAVFG